MKERRAFHATVCYVKRQLSKKLTYRQTSFVNFSFLSLKGELPEITI